MALQFTNPFKSGFQNTLFAKGASAVGGFLGGSLERAKQASALGSATRTAQPARPDSFTITPPQIGNLTLPSFTLPNLIGGRGTATPTSPPIDSSPPPQPTGQPFQAPQTPLVLSPQEMARRQAQANALSTTGATGGATQPQPAPQQPQFDVSGIQNQVAELQKTALGLQSQVSETQTPQPTPGLTPDQIQERIRQQEAFNRLRTLHGRVSDLSQVSPEEEEAQQRLSNLITSQELGIANVLDAPIARELQTGRIAALQRRASLETQPLLAQLSLLQQRRESAQTATTSQLDFAQEEVERLMPKKQKEKALSTQITEVGGKKVLVDTQTGEVIKDLGVAEVAETEGVTLSPGQVRFERDAQGNLVQVAAGGKRQPTETEIAKVLEKTEKNEAARSAQASTAGVINSILVNPRLSSVVGSVFGRLPIATADTAGVRGQISQLKALTSLEGREKLKGSGTISDFEASMLSDSANALNFAIDDDGFLKMNEDDATQNLKNIRGSLLLKAGQSVSAIVTDPSTGRSVQTTLTSKEANDLFLDGNIINFQ